MTCRAHPIVPRAAIALMAGAIIAEIVSLVSGVIGVAAYGLTPARLGMVAIAVVLFGGTTRWLWVHTPRRTSKS